MVLAAAGLVGALAVAWYPDARYTPYREGQRGSLRDSGAALRYVGVGTPLLRSPREATQPLPPLPSELASVYSRPDRDVGTTETSPTGDDLTSPAASPSPTASPSASRVTVGPGLGVGQQVTERHPDRLGQPLAPGRGAERHPVAPAVGLAVPVGLTVPVGLAVAVGIAARGPGVSGREPR